MRFLAIVLALVWLTFALPAHADSPSEGASNAALLAPSLDYLLGPALPLEGDAKAHQLTLLGFGPGNGIAAPCTPYPLYLDFAAGAPLQCYNNGTTGAPPSSFTGLTSTPGTVSGAGAGGTNVINAAGGVTNITSGSALSTTAGLFVTPGATANNVLASNAMSTSPWSAFDQTFTANQTTAPDGNNTAARLSATGTYPQQQQVITFPLNTAETCDVWFKPTGSGALQQIAGLWISSLSGGGSVAGFKDTTLNGTPTITTTSYGNVSLVGNYEVTYANGWKRFVINFTQTATETVVLTVSAGDTVTGTGGGNNQNGQTIYAWHADCGPGPETFDLPNSSAAAAVTRTKDTLTQAVPTSGQSTIVTVTYGGTHTQQLAPTTLIDLAASTDRWAGSSPINNVVITTPPSVPALASAAGYNTLTYSVPNAGFTADNVDLTGSLATGYLVYISNAYGQTSASLVGSLSVSGGNLLVGSHSAFVGPALSGTVKGASMIGTAFGGGFYFKEVADTPIAGANMPTASIAGSVLTVTGAVQGAIVCGGSGTGYEINAGGGDYGVYCASYGTGSGGAGTYNLSAVPAGGNISGQMTAAYEPYSWSTPAEFSSMTHQISNGGSNGGYLDQFIGQVSGYLNYTEQDICEDFFGWFNNNPWYCTYTTHGWAGVGSSINPFHSYPLQVFTGNATVTVTYEVLWKPATTSTNGSFAVWYNGVLTGTQTWAQQINFATTAATAPSTGSAVITLGTTCPSNIAAGNNVTDTTLGLYNTSVLGTVLTCSGTTLTMNANSAHAGSIGDNIRINESGSPTGQPWEQGVVDIDHLFWTSGCIDTANCVVRSMQYWQADASKNVHF